MVKFPDYGNDVQKFRAERGDGVFGVGGWAGVERAIVVSKTLSSDRKSEKKQHDDQRAEEQKR
jgi:hypothetical protein